MLFFLISLAFICTLYAIAFWFLKNPLFVPSQPILSAQSDKIHLQTHVNYLAAISPSRNSKNLIALNQAADYIKAEFQKSKCNIDEQVFEIEGQNYRNIVCSFGPESAPRIILGAHYDVHFENNPGADDNASGVAGIIELSRLLTQHSPDLKHRVDLVAYTLEEQPHFREHTMGSFIHAKSLVEQDIPVKLMVSIEMIGYFSDAPESQSYPLSFLKLFYPTTGNFIGVIGTSFDRSLVARAKRLMNTSERLPVYSINAPRFIPGVDLSDHRNFWHFNLPALMVTDTAFLRNPNYHQSTDTPDTLDYDRMSDVVNGLYRIAVEF
ncbi:MAG: M28 family peptidase [Pseudomonadota bacterium]